MTDRVETDGPTEAQIADVLATVEGERALQALAQGFVMADLLIPDAWQETDVPRCGDCARTLRSHKGHWTCVARGCSLYGESQGDGAPEDER